MLFEEGYNSSLYLYSATGQLKFCFGVLFSLIQYFKNTTLFELSTSSTQYCSHCSCCIPLLSDNLPNITCSNTQLKNNGSFSVYLGHCNLLRLIYQRLRHEFNKCFHIHLHKYSGCLLFVFVSGSTPPQYLFKNSSLLIADWKEFLSTVTVQGRV